MLPNWLYGKSKSKLASILGGGGGTPADYDQVKAQVTQNAEDIVLLNTNSQSLMAQSDSMVNVLGAKNLLPNNAVSKTVNGVTFTVNSDGSVTVNGTASAYAQFDLSSDIEYKEGKYILNGCPSEGGSSTYVIWVRNTAITTGITDAGSGATLNVTNVDTFKASIIVYSGATVNDLTFYPMLRLASITDDTYVPYSMTNRELTDRLTANANLGTAISLSIYTSYSNLYTAPSDGYVHFLSAASGSAARTIYTYGNNTNAATDPHFTHSTSANNKAFEIFIKKGLKIYIDGLQSGDTINFYPLDAEL